ncbi:hypothetical protein NP493_112g04005 [Ridgeia piscesae]|uniref:Uncharacterized protein n=1 Tax=Ridgeia piscesae TaxID=27915 RepID=A0AAD9P6V8_RIDPI|nr:hypothetical protein NP493_112g04005 [Ridgeia piscesae]
MRVSAVLLVVCLAVAFVATHGAAVKEVSSIEDSEEVAVDGDRFKRAAPFLAAALPRSANLLSHYSKTGPCKCWSWGTSSCRSEYWGCYCPLSTGTGGCYVNNGKGWHYASGTRGVMCWCEDKTDVLWARGPY